MQREVERLARNVAKLKRIVGVKNVGGDYHTVKAAALEGSVDVGLSIDSDFTDAERRRPDCTMIIDSFNVQVALIRQIIKEETTYDFIEEPAKSGKEGSLAILEIAEYREEDYTISKE